MNRHQVLTGAVNAGDSCSSVGSVEGVHFTVSSRKKGINLGLPDVLYLTGLSCFFGLCPVSCI